jgi:hypothetical protein
MKNIHILPTEKPSRLTIRIKTDEFMYSYKEFVNQKCEDISLNQNQHIYITSNEEIKEGIDQWYLDKVLNEPYTSGGAQYSSKQDVIILTTDQDLIAEGIQQIDDEFLEWFVKNPSCEEVEVKSFKSYSKDNYIMFIPKEEPKQSIQQFIEQHDITEQQLIDGYKQGLDLIFENASKITKQETLEEAAFRLYPINIIIDYDTNEEIRNIWIEGAKWQAERMGLMEIELRHTKTLLASCEKALEDRDKQAERMYSEEDVKEAFFSGCQSERQIKPRIKCWEQWFEQFKKK